jgi:uncharacterized protein (DUF1810 family)
MNNERRENDFIKFKDKIELEGKKALKEIKDGVKVSHWMWYFFPQIYGLGYSYESKYYGIKSLDEAKKFLEDEELKYFIKKITSYVKNHIKNGKRTVTGIFGPIDNHKFLSSMTLFYYAAKSLNNRKLKKLFKFCKKASENELGKKDDFTKKKIKKSIHNI